MEDYFWLFIGVVLVFSRLAVVFQDGIPEHPDPDDDPLEKAWSDNNAAGM
jgi:hypothetical protein